MIKTLDHAISVQTRRATSKRGYAKAVRRFCLKLNGDPAKKHKALPVNWNKS